MEQLKFFGCLLAFVTTIAPLHGETMTYIDDVDIYINATYWKCDMIDCPPETYYCRVTKQKLEPDATQVQRVNTCYYRNNTVRLEAINYDAIGATENISLNITSYSTGGMSYTVSSSSSVVGGSMTVHNS